MRNVVNAAPVALWLGGHTHLLHPFDNGPVANRPRGPVAIKPPDYPAATFVNVASLQRTTAAPGINPSMSRLLIFVEGEANARLRTQLHSQTLRNRSFAPDGHGVIGEYRTVRWQLPLGRAFVYPR